jgi:hypothetical protein
MGQAAVSGLSPGKSDAIPWERSPTGRGLRDVHTRFEAASPQGDRPCNARPTSYARVGLDGLPGSKICRGALSKLSPRHQPLTRDGAIVIDSSIRRRAPTPHSLLCRLVVL